MPTSASPAFKLPKAPSSIEKGRSLKQLLDRGAIECLANNLALVHTSFDARRFEKVALQGVKPLELLQRGRYLASVLFEFLPRPYHQAVDVLLASLTPPLSQTEQNGLAVFFYLPHICFIAQYGLNPEYNAGIDPFEISMRAQYELTRRFSAEFSIRNFLIQEQSRTLRKFKEWSSDPCPHVRRLCSEGARPRLPWAIRIPAFIKDPRPCLPILERLKDDESLYVRRSVANHLGDIAKDHRDLALSIAEKWLDGASRERKWVIRHAVRYLAKKGDPKALNLRSLATDRIISPPKMKHSS